MVTEPEALSGGALSRRSSGPQADPSAQGAREAVLWILNTDAQWHMLHAPFSSGAESDVIRAALTDLANTLRDEGAVDESECYIDAAFASAKGGSEEIGPNAEKA